MVAATGEEHNRVAHVADPCPNPDGVRAEEVVAPNLILDQLGDRHVRMEEVCVHHLALARQADDQREGEPDTHKVSECEVEVKQMVKACEEVHGGGTPGVGQVHALPSGEVLRTGFVAGEWGGVVASSGALRDHGLAHRDLVLGTREGEEGDQPPSVREGYAMEHGATHQ